MNKFGYALFAFAFGFIMTASFVSAGSALTASAWEGHHNGNVHHSSFFQVSHHEDSHDNESENNDSHKGQDEDNQDVHEGDNDSHDNDAEEVSNENHDEDNHDEDSNHDEEDNDNHEGDNDNGGHNNTHEKVDVCHKDGQSGNWNILNIDKSGWDNGHSGHGDDFLYEGTLDIHGHGDKIWCKDHASNDDDNNDDHHDNDHHDNGDEDCDDDNGNNNNAPTANAGVDQTITLPTNSVTLDGSGSTDSDGTISSYAWTFVSGPSNVNPNDTSSANATPLVAGTYIFKLTVTDNDGATDDDTVSITVNPVVAITPQCSDSLDNDSDGLINAADPGCHSDGNVNNSDSYVPLDNSEVNESAVCSDGLDNDQDNKIDSLDPGCHTDGNASNINSWNPNDNNETDDVLGDQNSAPTANAGVNQTITLPTNSVNLDGSASVDSDGTISSYVWSFVSGPSNVNPNDTVSLNATGLVAGTYVFQLIVTDNDGATDSDTVSVTVNGAQVVVTTQCSDGIDNDHDGHIDFPSDKGCKSLEDNDEKNSSGGSVVGGHISGTVIGGQVLGEQTSCGIYVEKYLRKGYNNNVETVKKVQIFLNNYMQSGLVVDGVYGSKTEAAVNAFQLTRKTNVLNPWNISAPTGIFYLTTQTEVNNIMCPTLGLPIPSNLVNFTPNVIN